MKTVSGIIALWPDVTAFAGDLGLLRVSHARTMQTRGSIPRWYWDRVLEKAKERGLILTKEDLETVHAGKRQFGAVLHQIPSSRTEAA